MKTLGIDYGKKHVGIAYSEGLYATTLTTIATPAAVSYISEHVKKLAIEQCVIGLPEGPLASVVLAFGKNLAAQLTCPVVYWDETLTSQSAAHFIAENGQSQKRRKKSEHAVAAALMLESYMQNQKNI